MNAKHVDTVLEKILVWDIAQLLVDRNGLIHGVRIILMKINHFHLGGQIMWLRRNRVKTHCFLCNHVSESDTNAYCNRIGYDQNTQIPIKSISLQQSMNCPDYSRNDHGCGKCGKEFKWDLSNKKIIASCDCRTFDVTKYANLSWYM